MLENQDNKTDWRVLRRIIQLAMPDRVRVYLAVLLAILLSILGPLRPLLVERSIDNYVLKNNLNGLYIMFFWLVVVLILDSIVRYYFSFITSWLGQQVVYRLRTKVFNHIINLRLRYFDTNPIGMSVTRTISDVERVNDVFSEGLINIVADLLTILFILFFMFYTNWKLSLVACITFPFMFFATYWFKESVKKNFKGVRNAVAKLNTFLQEHISGMSVEQYFTAEGKEFEKFKNINITHRDENIKTIWSYSLFFPLIEIILSVAIGLTVWYGSLLVIDHEAQPGIIVSFIMYVNLLFRPLRVLADTFNTLQMGIVTAERVFQVLDTNESISNNGTLQPDTLHGEVSFNNVSFAYNDSNLVLKNINFKVNSGEILAVVGSTGSGKTSLINVLTRSYEIQSGDILIDNRSIKEYELHYLQNHIGIVLQDVFLFNASIYDNITLQNPAISREKVAQAAILIGADEFINKLPNKYDYQVMERGGTLSMGQRQIISFLRCLVYDPKILVLDEASSNIDSESESLIQKAVEKMIKGRTSIVIAHRLSTIQHADKILVMQHGEVVEMGSQSELLSNNKHYASLYKIQFEKSGL